MQNGQDIRIIVILLHSRSLHFYKSSRVRIVRPVVSDSVVTWFRKYSYAWGLYIFVVPQWCNYYCYYSETVICIELDIYVYYIWTDWDIALYHRFQEYSSYLVSVSYIGANWRHTGTFLSELIAYISIKWM